MIFPEFHQIGINSAMNKRQGRSNANSDLGLGDWDSPKNFPEALAPTIWNDTVRTCELWSNHTVHSEINELVRFPYNSIHLFCMQND